MLVDAVKTITHRSLPSGWQFRTLLFGPLAGSQLKINLHHDLRLYLGLYEIEIQKWFRRLIKPGYRSFDAGGAAGYTALLISKYAKGGQVVSFECEDFAVDTMRQTFAINKAPIKAVQAFIGKEPQQLSLDDAADRYFVPDFIKLDIEGAEADALEGNSRVLSNRKPSLIVEVHGKEIEDRCLRILRSYRYQPIVVDRHRLLREKRSIAHNRWLVCP